MGSSCLAETTLDSLHMVCQQEGLLPGTCSSPQDEAPNLFCNSRFEVSGHALYLDNKRWAKCSPVVLKTWASESPESSLKHILLYPTPKVPDSDALG